MGTATLAVGYVILVAIVAFVAAVKSVHCGVQIPAKSSIDCFRREGYADVGKSATAARYAAHRPALDARSAEALTAPAEPTPTQAALDPETALWQALTRAPEHGLSVPTS
jgi:hypothetical protein